MASSSSCHHKGRCCGPCCYLCGKEQSRYDHFSTLSTEQQKFLQRYSSTSIPDDSCICRSHRMEAQRNHLNDKYIPAWRKKGTENANMQCTYPDCTITSKTSKIIVPSDATQAKFRELQNTPKASTEALCDTHYQLLYRRSHIHTPCAGCGAKPKARQCAFTRHSPDAESVSLYLSAHTEFSVTLTATDTLCKSCYNTHLVILRYIENLHNEQHSLQSDMMLWNMTMNEEGTTPLTKAVLATVIFVGKLLQQDRALLLPQAVQIFVSHYSSDEDVEDLYLDVGDSTIKFNARWLMNQLIIHLQPFISYKCVVKRLGTLIYPNNADVLKCLSLALYNSNKYPGHEGSILHVSQSDYKSLMLREAGNVINDKIHEEVKRLNNHTTDLTSFNLEESIKNTNPLLWDFVCLCTRSVRERTGQINNDDAHTKKVRRYFIICMMIFATNPSCNTTVHHLVADTVEVLGGSRQLIRLLNRLGACVCPDTHDRLVTYVAKQQKEASLWNELSPATFTVVSVDNIDFLQSHAAVYSGDQSRSYHGTTIQVVQPVPSITLGKSSEPSVSSSHSAIQFNQQHSIETLRGSVKSTGLATKSTTVAINRQPQPVASLELPANLHKRPCSSSPANSPHKHGKHGPKRHRTMVLSPKNLFCQQSSNTPNSSTPSNSSNTSHSANLHRREMDINHFKEKEGEIASKRKLSAEIFAYFLQKHVKARSDLGEALKPLQEFLLPTQAQLADHNPSTLYYMDLLDENADSEETMAEVAEMLNEKIRTDAQKWALLVGDGKTYEHLLKVKRLYGSTLENLLIFPGDWHVLKNFQPLLMKAYYHVGLREVAKASGFRAETLASLERCSHFKRTHCFLMQVWEAMYAEMVHAFVAANPQFNSLKADLEAAVEFHNNDSTSNDLLLKVQYLVSEASALVEFRVFIDKLSETDSTWQLWSNFVFNDCFSYIALFFAIRTSNWDLRVSSLKCMAPLFAAYDRQCYQRLIPSHIADIHRYPREVIESFKKGGFTVKVTGGIGHAVALDEAHEMCINRDIKMAVARPTLPYLKKTTHFFSYRIKAQKQFASQIFPPATAKPPNSAIWDSRSTTKRWEENVEKMHMLIRNHSLFKANIESNRGLVNVFTNEQATLEQTYDLLNARKIGEQGYLNYVTHRILQLPSVDIAPVRHKQLLTMAPRKVTKKRISQQQKEQRDTNKYLRRRLAWCNQTGQKYDESKEQYSILPRSLAEIDGSPRKGNKSKWTEKLEARYRASDISPFQSTPEWIPDVAIIDAMFIINTNPLRQHKTLEQYAEFLFRQYAVPHLHLGTNEVHFVFDYPARLSFNPKDCEHKRRYAGTKKDHSHIIFDPQSTVPRPWRDYLDCRQCKRSLVEALGLAYLQRANSKLKDGQTLILAGCFTGEQQDYAWEITGSQLVPKLTDTFQSNAQEADMRVWRHALQSTKQRILIYSPDTDVYNIGLTLVHLPVSIQYLVQINLPHNSPRYISINKLLLALRRDPDLASLPQSKLGEILQQLYIVTGCDYVSYVAGIGKATFLKIFFQHADFITGNGDLSLTDSCNMNTGFLAFIRLMGTAYFKKNLAAVVSRIGLETPRQLYNSITLGSSSEEKCKEWYLRIRKVVPVLTEDQRPPTLSALWRHWERSCWVQGMWKNSSKSDQHDRLPPPELHGWVKDSAGYSIDWESEEVQQQIQETLDFLSRGCTCKTGCLSKRCSCQRKERSCGAGCECRGCKNILSHTQPEHEDEDEVNEDEVEEDEVNEDEVEEDGVDEDEVDEDEVDEDGEHVDEEENEEEMEEDVESELQIEIITDMTTDEDISVCWF